MNYTETINALRSSHQLHNDNGNTELLKKILKEAFPSDPTEIEQCLNWTHFRAQKKSTHLWNAKRMESFKNIPTIKLSEVVEDGTTDKELLQKVIDLTIALTVLMDKQIELNKQKIDIGLPIYNDPKYYEGFVRFKKAEPLMMHPTEIGKEFNRELQNELDKIHIKANIDSFNPKMESIIKSINETEDIKKFCASIGIKYFKGVENMPMSEVHKLRK